MDFYTAEATPSQIAFAFCAAGNIDNILSPIDAATSTIRKEMNFAVHDSRYYSDYRVKPYTSSSHLSYYSANFSNAWNNYKLPNLPSCAYSRNTVAESFLFEEQAINQYEGEIVNDERRLDNACEYIINIPPIKRQQKENVIQQEFGNEKQSHFSNKTACKETVSSRRTVPKKRVKCALCEKDFACNTNYKVHLRTHTGCKPYSCIVCVKKFANQQNLSVHMRSHTGVKPYSCRECDKCFSDASTLIKHRRIHSGLRPFSCDVCGKTFSQSGNMKRHRKSHRVNY